MTTSRSERRWSTRRVLAAAAMFALAIVAARLLTLRSFDDGLPPALDVVAGLPVTLPGGGEARLGGRLRPGVPTVVTLWASWCGPCRAEAPAIADLRRRFGPDRLNLVYLNVRDAAAPAPVLAAWMTGFGMAADGYVRMADIHVPVLTNALDLLIPRTLVFDRAGRPVASITGYKPLALARVAGLIEQDAG